MRHFLLAVLYSACVAAFFSALLRQDFRSARRLFLTIFGVMVGGVWLVGWLMVLLAP